MNAWPRNPLLFIPLLIWAIPIVMEAQTAKYAGRPVADVLRELQSDDLRIIFSSDLVPLSLLVAAEPKSRNPREIAQQILAAHGLALKKGPPQFAVEPCIASAPEAELETAEGPC